MSETAPVPSAALPDTFDRMLGQLKDLPGTLHVKPSVIPAVPLFGVGGSTFYTVQSFRVTDEHDEKKTTRFVTFLIIAGPTGYFRHVLPDDVTDLMIRQRDALGKKAQRQTGKRLAAERKAAGIVPGFLRSKRAGKKR